MTSNLAKKCIGILAALAVVGAFNLSAPDVASAQVSVGAQGSYGTEVEALGVGARVNYMIPEAGGFGLAGSFDYFFPDGYDYWEVNANGTYSFAASGSVLPYLGAGLNYADVSVSGQSGGVTFSASTNEAGLNVLGGLQFSGGGGITPYVEGRYATTFDGQFVITGGILF